MKIFLTILFYCLQYTLYALTVSIGNDREIPVSTYDLVNGLQSVPLTSTVNSSSAITSYSWTLDFNGSNSYLDDNLTPSASFSNARAANTNFLTRPYLGSYRIVLTVQNSAGESASSTINLRIGEGLTGGKKNYYFYLLGGTYSYALARDGQPHDANQYFLPHTFVSATYPQNVWDNERDGNSQPTFNMYSRVMVTTTAPYIVLRMATEWAPSSKLGLSVNGVRSSVICPADRGDCRIDLGTAGTLKFVEIVNGYQGIGAGLPAKGTYLRAIIYDSTFTFNVIPPPSKENRILFLGDSEASTQEEGQEFNSVFCKLRYPPYNLQTMFEAGGAIAFTMYTDDSARRAQLKALIVKAKPAVIWNEWGTNDFGLNGGYASLSNYKAKFNSFWKETLPDLPLTKFYFQTEYPRGNCNSIDESYSPTNALGWKLEDARNVKRDFVLANPVQTEIVEGPELVTFNCTNFPDHLHRFTAGHAEETPKVASILNPEIIIIVNPPANVNCSFNQTLNTKIIR